MSTNQTPGRLACTGWSFARMLVTVLVLVDFCLVTTALGLVPIGIGALLLIVLVPKLAWLADVFRTIAARTLTHSVPSAYAPTDGMRPWDRLRTWVADEWRWRDLLWTLVCINLGWALDIIVVTLALWPVFALVLPLLFHLAPSVGWEVMFGLVTPESLVAMWAWAWAEAVIAAAAWWFLARPLTVARSRLDASLLSPSRERQLEERVAEVSASRADTIDHSAAELRRIERDLHDGAQARLVALGMNLGLADEVVANDPEKAQQLIAEARQSATSALGDLRTVVRGIHPPVLADRGLAGAVEALALDMRIPIATHIELPGRLPAPVESALYFAIAECLANIGKHSCATSGAVDLTYEKEAVRVVVSDDGIGGAGVASGSGLAGLGRRLAAFDGTMMVSSPVGGPTIVSMEVPCESSSVRTTPCSGRGSSGS